MGHHLGPLNSCDILVPLGPNTSSYIRLRRCGHTKWLQISGLRPSGAWCSIGQIARSQAAGMSLEQLKSLIIQSKAFPLLKSFPYPYAVSGIVSSGPVSACSLLIQSTTQSWWSYQMKKLRRFTNWLKGPFLTTLPYILVVITVLVFT